MIFCFNASFLQFLYSNFRGIKLYAVLSLFILSVFSQPSVAKKFPEKYIAHLPEDTKEFYRCLETNTNVYCGKRHSEDGRVICIEEDRETAEAVDWKADGQHGKRNDCVFVVEIAQFSNDGAVLIEKTVQAGEVFAIEFKRRSNIAACRSPLKPVYDPETPLNFRCVKK